MSDQWQKKLQTLINLSEERLAIVGIGNVLRGDDAIGVRIVESLMKNNLQHDNLLLINGGTTPESTIGLLRRFAPQIILIIDACDIQGNVGDIILVNLDNSLAAPIASSHALSLRMFVSYVTREFRVSVYLLGIQPFRTEMMSPLSKEIAKGLSEVVNYFQLLLHGIDSISSS